MLQRVITSATRLYNMEDSIKIGTHYYDLTDDHFSLKWEKTLDYIHDLAHLSRFPNLKSANFACSDLNDAGLMYVADCSKIESLNVQETEITDEGITYLKQLNKLKYLRLKGNPQLTNACVPSLTEIHSLEDLHIQETSITYEGLKHITVMKQLKELIVEVWKNNYTYEELLQLSQEMPDCSILAKGKGLFLNGEFDGKWGG